MSIESRLKRLEIAAAQSADGLALMRRLSEIPPGRRDHWLERLTDAELEALAAELNRGMSNAELAALHAATDAQLEAIIAIAEQHPDANIHQLLTIVERQAAKGGSREH